MSTTPRHDAAAADPGFVLGVASQAVLGAARAWRDIAIDRAPVRPGGKFLMIGAVGKLSRN